MPVTSKKPTEQRQSDLIAAALSLAAQRSPAEITTAELAAAVGLSQAAVFRHFTSKEAVWLAALDWVHGHLMAELRAAAQQASPLTTLRAVVLAHADFVAQYPGVPRLVFQELQHPQPTPLKAKVRDLLQDYRDFIRSLLQAAVAGHSIAPAAMNIGAEVLFLGAIQGLAMQAMLMDDSHLLKRQAPALVDVMLTGLRHLPAQLAEPNQSISGAHT